MVWIWGLVFDTAVTLAMFGFCALVLHRGVWIIACLVIVGVIAPILYYLWFRPELVSIKPVVENVARPGPGTLGDLSLKLSCFPPRWPNHRKRPVNACI
jgi:hypothetical protein